MRSKETQIKDTTWAASFSPLKWLKGHEKKSTRPGGEKKVGGLERVSLIRLTKTNERKKPGIRVMGGAWARGKLKFLTERGCDSLKSATERGTKAEEKQKQR